MANQTDLHSKYFDQLRDLKYLWKSWANSAQKDYNLSRKLEKLGGGGGEKSRTDVERSQLLTLYTVTVYAHAVLEGMVRDYALAMLNGSATTMVRYPDERLQCDLLADQSVYRQDKILNKAEKWASDVIKEDNCTSEQATGPDDSDVVQRIRSLTKDYPEWRRLAELNLIRNLIAHNGGRMSSTVHRHVKICEVGQPIPWTREHWLTSVHCLFNFNNYLALNTNPVE